jgi:hypothetical protein
LQAAFQLGQFLKKTAVLLSTAIIFGAVGLVVPLMFDRDVGGALASALLAIGGLIVGGILGAIVVNRAFD